MRVAVGSTAWKSMKQVYSVPALVFGIRHVVEYGLSIWCDLTRGMGIMWTIGPERMGGWILMWRRTPTF